ncbi:hypothetical protein PoB_005831500 [Plakobranchus ocellatus]|uniref:Uncharacterized protein n=1 Tax=Plakobranchus ocellatus TaxID=259542 RepID=A0AAV4CG60_9GAST|nr:hypothetical protein PoB_005831500 [Plakobranchus ocellatus]
MQKSCFIDLQRRMLQLENVRFRKCEATDLEFSEFKVRVYVSLTEADHSFSGSFGGGVDCESALSSTEALHVACASLAISALA